MTGTDGAATYRAIIAAVSNDQLEQLDQLVAPDLVDHNASPGQPAGRDGFKAWAEAAREALPDLTGTVEDTLGGNDNDNDKVAGRVTWRGSHRGLLAGVPGTGVRVEFCAFHIVRFRDGMAVEWWGTADILGALLQSGATITARS